MAIKKCESCGDDFETESNARTCSVTCRNRLISSERKAKHIQTRDCVICGKSFSFGAKNWKRETCSPECGHKLRGSKMARGEQRTCLTCGKSFYAKRSQIHGINCGGKYCSKACMYGRNKASTTRNCECCGKEFSTPPSQMHIRACSLECGYKIRDHGEKDKVAVICSKCGREFFEHESHAGRRKFCSQSCAKTDSDAVARMSSAISGKLNPAWKGGVTRKAVSESGKPYSRMPLHIESEKAVRRRRARDAATPKWANLELVREFYRLANRISLSSGIKHHVDHIVPLKSDIVCGLHNQFNLQVIPGKDNLRKHNRYWPDMP